MEKSTNKNIRNINRIGKIMKIIMRIMQVFFVLGFIAIAAVIVFVMAAPLEDIRVRPSFHVDVDYNTKDFDSSNSDLKLNNKKFSTDIADFAFDIYTKTHKISNTTSTLTIDGDSEEITGKEIRSLVIKKLIISELFIAAAFVALMFGIKLAKAFQTCSTPFSDEIITKLTSFGKSLIPLGIVSLFTDGLGTGILIPLLLLFMFISLFKYGAELQKEADETV